MTPDGRSDRSTCATPGGGSACQIELARTIATVAHLGQVDKAGAAYIEHPRRVAGRCTDAGYLAVAAAWLHDVIEDTLLNAEALAELGVHPSVIKAVQLLTRKRGPQDSYYAALESDKAGIARAVKLADIADNTDPERLALLDPATQTRLLTKYSKAYRALGCPELSADLDRRNVAAPATVHDSITLWVDGVHRISQVHLLELAAVMHGMADHTHVLRATAGLAELESPAAALHQYLTGIVRVLSGCDGSDDSRWGAERIMASQSVSTGTPSQHAIRGHQSAVPVSEVARVLASISLEHCEFMWREIFVGRGMLDGRGERERWWPEELSLGRYFHALGDSAESAAWESQ